ncbi:MAG: GumC family protein [Halanaerobiales bacterium]
MNEEFETSGETEVYEIDLREYLQLLWNYRKTIIVIFLAAIVLAWAISTFLITPEYRSELVIHTPKFSLINGDSLSRNDHISFASRQGIREEIIEELELSDYRAQDLRNKVDISTYSERISSGEGERELLTFSLRDSEPRRARSILSLWAELFSQEVTDYVDDRNENYFNQLEQEMEERENNYDQAREELRSFREENNISLLKSRLQKKEDRFVEVESELDSVRDNLEKYRSEQTTLAEQMAEADKFIVTRDVLSPDDRERLQKLLKNPDISGFFEIDREQLNPLYTELAKRDSSLEREIVTLERELELLKAGQDSLDEEVEALEVEIAQLEDREERLEERKSTAGSNFRSAEESYASARQDLAENDYSISVVNGASLPQNPVRPRVKLNIVIAGFLSLILAVFVVFIREFMKEEN